MTDLVKRVQYALLTDAGPEKVRALLVELAIPSGGLGGGINDVRRSVLYPCSDIAVLRNAFANIGITGGTGDPRAALSDIREAIMRDVTTPELVLRRGLNALLAPGDLVGIPTSIVMIATPEPSGTGASVTLTATVTPSTATGTVTFNEQSALGDWLVDGSGNQLTDGNGNHLTTGEF